METGDVALTHKLLFAFEVYENFITRRTTVDHFSILKELKQYFELIKRKSCSRITITSLILNKKFQRRLDDISTDYNFDSGHEFEIAVCEVLRDFLPLKYGICRGNVVSYDGTKRGDDIIIYDQERFPTLRLNKKENFSRKENIPIEAVYAYFEAKHTITEETLKKALNQIIEVRKLINTREEMPAFMTDPYELPRAAMVVHGMPRFRNASFTGIISRHLNLKPENNANHGRDYLANELAKKVNEDADFLPEFILAGPSLTAEIGTIKEGAFKLTIFNMPTLEKGYEVRRVGELGYGVF